MFKRETILMHMKHELGNHNATIPITPAVDAARVLSRDHAFMKLIPLAIGGFMQYAKSAWGEEPNKIGSPDMGAVYTKCIEITEGGRSDAQMRTAKKLYKSQNLPSFNTTSSNYSGNTAWSAVFGAAGEMRQGVFSPTKFNEIIGFPTDFKEAAYTTVFQSQMMTQLFLWYEIYNRLMNSTDQAWLDNRPAESSSDMYFCINYIEDEVTIANAMEFSTCDLTIYLCKCKTATKFSPMQAWFVPQDQSPANPFEYMRSDYVYPGNGVVVNFPGELNKTNGQVCYPYANVHLGATPFYSPRFRDQWEVIDVIKKDLKSTDKLVLKIKREFRKAMSARDLDFLKDTIGHGLYNPGDYGLLITYKGTPTFMRYTGGTVGPGEQRVRETDCGPAKIVVNSRSSFGISSPDLKTSIFTPVDSIKGENYVSGEGRVLDTEIRTRPFLDSEWGPEVVTNVYTAEGGPRD